MSLLSYFRFVCSNYPDSVECLWKSFLGLFSYEFISKGSKDFSAPNAPPPVLNDNITFFYTNIRSLVPKLHHLNNYIGIHEPTVVGITETWLDDGTPSSLFRPPNYEIYRKDRLHTRGGGSLLMVDNGIISKPVDVLPSGSTRVDAIACEVALVNDLRLGCLCIYRPPNTTKDEDITVYQIMTKFLSYDFDYNIIMGDFNYPDICWPLSAQSSQSEAFLTFCLENFLEQHVTWPTRRQSNTILDLILTTPGTIIKDMEVNEEVHTSDHSVLQFSFPVRPLRMKRIVKMRNIRGIDSVVFEALLSNYPDWNNILLSNDVNKVWHSFLSHINSVLDSIAPYRVIKTRNFISCSKVRTALRHKRRSFKRFSSNPTLENLAIYNKATVIADRRVADDLVRREIRVQSTTEPRLFWSYVNRRLSRDHTINSLNSGTSKIEDHVDMANAFNVFFASNFSQRGLVQSDNDLSSISPGTFSFSPITYTDVLKVLKNLPSKSSTDADGLSYSILKLGQCAVAYLLSGLFNISLETAEIPHAWKMALVTPIHKGGPKNLVNNYRPISVTSCCSRILERLVRGQMTKFLTQHNLILDTQHAFIQGRSTTTALLSFYDFITDALDKNLSIHAIFFDFAKAFDKVSHEIMMLRMKQHGFRGKPYNWLLNFLTDRTQRVKIGTKVSEILPVSSGIIQGSVLGPTLFNVFINEIDYCLDHCHILKYADDIRIFRSSRRDDSSIHDLMIKIQHDVNNIYNWTETSLMHLNTTKCFVVAFGQTSSFQPNYSISDTSLPFSSSFRDLGICVCSPFSFKSHMNSIVAQAFSKLGVINRVFRMKSRHAVLQLFKAYVRPLLEYSSIIWCPHSTVFCQKLERVQKRMCRMIPGIRHLSYRKQLESLDIPSLKARRLKHQLIFLFKLIRNLTTIRFHDYFSLVNDKRTRGHSHTMAIKYARHNYRLHFFNVSIIDTWNKLPQRIVDAPNLTKFKEELTSYFRENDIW